MPKDLEMTNLHDALGAFLADWRADLPQPWHTALAEVSPDLDAVAPHLALQPGERIYPLRRGHGDPGAPAGSHVFRAFDGLAPDAVRVVLLGQDPYPALARATGRSFEQGDLDAWDGHVTKSLRRMVQTLAQHRQPSAGYVPNDSAWSGVRSGILAGQPAIEPPGALFDNWQAAGVLCLNLGLTLSRFDRDGTPANERVQPAHMALWKPVVREVLLHLVRRTGRELLVILWGGKAQAAFDQMGVEAAASAAGQGGRLAVVRRAHPAADGPTGNAGAALFLQLQDDPYTQANRKLAAIGAAQVHW